MIYFWEPAWLSYQVSHSACFNKATDQTVRPLYAAVGAASLNVSCTRPKAQIINIRAADTLHQERLAEANAKALYQNSI